MVIIGIDPHPGSHTVAIVDQNGRSLDYLKIPNDNSSEAFKQP